MHSDVFHIQRRITRRVPMGATGFGSEYPIMVQSMTNTKTHDTEATLQQIRCAATAGAQMMRVTVPDKDAVEAFREIVEHSPVPIAADIHFDYRLAIGAVKAGAAKIRINPGNIGSEWKIREVVNAARDRNVPVRVGVNAGSLESSILKKYRHPTAEALAESALCNAAILSKMDFKNIVLSLKSSSVPVTIAAYRSVAARCEYPLHIGVTEAGTILSGAVRSSVGLGILLGEGIGDTIRVSLAANPVEEIRVAYRILESLGICRRGPTIIACPTCGRTQIDIIGLAEAVEDKLKNKTTPLTVAVMGCIVNGPGEAKEADIGVAGSRGEALLFQNGKPLRKVPENQILDELVRLFDEVASQKKITEDV